MAEGRKCVEGFLMSVKQVNVVFQPEGKRASVAEGSTILDAAIKVGVDLSSICKGIGVCGKCQVVIVEGAENLSPLTDSEKRHLGDEKIGLGCLLYTSPSPRDRG